MLNSNYKKINYKQKYLKYRSKYDGLLEQTGGNWFTDLFGKKNTVEDEEQKLISKTKEELERINYEQTNQSIIELIKHHPNLDYFITGPANILKYGNIEIEHAPDEWAEFIDYVKTNNIGLFKEISIDKSTNYKIKLSKEEIQKLVLDNPYNKFFKLLSSLNSTDKVQINQINMLRDNRILEEAEDGTVLITLGKEQVKYMLHTYPFQYPAVNLMRLVVIGDKHFI
jgi:hypothetical protein